MIRNCKIFLIIILATAVVLGATAVGAQQEKPYSKPYPIGFVNITLKTVAAGVGLEWGSGILTYKGKQYTFKVHGISVANVGIAVAHAKGDVYNLMRLANFPGHYAAASAGMAVFKGKTGMAFKNDEGVTILLNAVEKGVNLNIGPEGFTIKMEQAL